MRGKGKWFGIVAFTSIKEGEGDQILRQSFNGIMIFLDLLLS